MLDNSVAESSQQLLGSLLRKESKLSSTALAQRVLVDTVRVQGNRSVVTEFGVPADKFHEFSLAHGSRFRK